MKKMTGTVVIFAAAAALIAFSGIGGARAALTYRSENLTARVETSDIGVGLVENGTAVAVQEKGSSDGTEVTGTLLNDLSEIVPGKVYKEELSVVNAGDYPAYMRVTIKKYWKDADVQKCRNLSPDFIKLHFPENSGWVRDEEASTAEREVFYYTSLVAPDQTTDLLADQLMVDQAVATKVTQSRETEGAFTTITTAYDYNGYQVCLEAKADAIQDHSTEKAAVSVWGSKVHVDEEAGTLRLE